MRDAVTRLVAFTVDPQGYQNGSNCAKSEVRSIVFNPSNGCFVDGCFDGQSPAGPAARDARVPNPLAHRGRQG